MSPVPCGCRAATSVRPSLEVVALLLGASGVVAQLRRQLRFGQQGVELAGEGGGVRRRGEQAVVAVLQDIGNAADRERHHRHAGLHRFEQNHRRALGARADHQRIELLPPALHRRLVTRQANPLLQTGSIDARLQGLAFRAVTEHHRVQLRMLMTQRDQRIKEQIRTFLAAQPTDVTGQPALPICHRLHRRCCWQTVGNHLQLLRPDVGLQMQRGDALCHADHPFHRRRAAQLQAQPGVELLFAAARREAVLGDHQRQAQQRGADPAEQQPFEVVGVEQRLVAPALTQVPQQLAQPGTTTGVHPSLTKARDQFRRCVEEQHLVLPRRGQAMIQQHPLGPVEAAAAEQMNDRQGDDWGGHRVQLRTQ